MHRTTGGLRGREKEVLAIRKRNTIWRRSKNDDQSDLQSPRMQLCCISALCSVAATAKSAPERNNYPLEWPQHAKQILRVISSDFGTDDGIGDCVFLPFPASTYVTSYTTCTPGRCVPRKWAALLIWPHGTRRVSPPERFLAHICLGNVKDAYMLRRSADENLSRRVSLDIFFEGSTKIFNISLARKRFKKGLRKYVTGW